MKADRYGRAIEQAAGDRPDVPDVHQIAQSNPAAIPRKATITPEELTVLRDLAAKALKRTDDGLELFGCTGNAAGLLVPDEITPDAMTELADTLFGFEGRIQLYVGDMLAQSEKLAYGTYETVAIHYRREADTLYKWKSVCAAVSIFLRRKILAAYPDNPLTITHYEIVMALSEAEQETWLTVAARDGWTTRKLSAEINRARLPVQETATTDNTTLVLSGVQSDKDEADWDVPPVPNEESRRVDRNTRRQFNSLWKKKQTEGLNQNDVEDLKFIRNQIDVWISTARHRK
jgi:hypothetical protein